MSEGCFKRPRIKRVLRKTNTVRILAVSMCGGLHMTPTFAGEAVRRDPGQAVFTDVAKGGPCMGAGVPVVHP